MPDSIAGDVQRPTGVELPSAKTPIEAMLESALDNRMKPLHENISRLSEQIATLTRDMFEHNITNYRSTEPKGIPMMVSIPNGAPSRDVIDLAVLLLNNLELTCNGNVTSKVPKSLARYFVPCPVSDTVNTATRREQNR